MKRGAWWSAWSWALEVGRCLDLEVAVLCRRGKKQYTHMTLPQQAGEGCIRGSGLSLGHTGPLYYSSLTCWCMCSKGPRHSTRHWLVCIYLPAGSIRLTSPAVFLLWLSRETSAVTRRGEVPGCHRHAKHSQPRLPEQQELIASASLLQRPSFSRQANGLLSFPPRTIPVSESSYPQNSGRNLARHILLFIWRKQWATGLPTGS